MHRLVGLAIAIVTGALLLAPGSSVRAESAELGQAAIKTMLLATRDWLSEYRNEGDNDFEGENLMRFEVSGEQLLAHVFVKYESRWVQTCSFEVEVVADGFNFPGCMNFPKVMKFDAKDRRIPFKGSGGPFAFTIRPM